MPFRTSPVVAEDEWLLGLEVDDGIARLTLNRPEKLNAWSWEATRQLGARANQIRFDERVRVVLV
jgi:enoyl-CoA hydratase